MERGVNGTYQEIMYTPVGKTAIMNGQSTAVNAYFPLPGGQTYDQTGTADGTGYFWHKDWLGSVRLASSVQNRTFYFDRAFAPYGEMYKNFGNTGGLDFTGDTQDSFSGLLFDTPYRELSSSQGRWLSPDPTGARWNLYSYTTNPLALTDPSGLSPDGCGHWCNFDARDYAGGGCFVDPNCATTYIVDGMEVPPSVASFYLSFGAGGQGSWMSTFSTSAQIDSVGLEEDESTMIFTPEGGGASEIDWGPNGPWGTRWNINITTNVTSIGIMQTPSAPANNIPTVSQWLPPKSKDFVTAPPGPYHPTVGECITNPGDAVDKMLGEGGGPQVQHDPSIPVQIYQPTQRGNRSINGEEGEAEGAGYAIIFDYVFNYLACLVGSR